MIEASLFEILICVTASLGAGIATGFAGLSAATFISPMLVTFLHMDPFEAIGIALASDVLASAASSVTYYRHGNIELKKCLPLIITILVCTVGGSVASYYFTSTTAGNVVMNYWTIIVSLFFGISFLISPMRRDYSSANSLTNRVLPSVICGVYIGFICGFQGTGGGLMILFALAILLGYSVKTSVGTSVFIMTFTALIGAGTHFIMNGVQHLTLLLICIVVTFAAAQISAIIANRIRTVRCSVIIGILLVVSTMIMFGSRIYSSSLPPAATVTLWCVLGAGSAFLLYLIIRAIIKTSRKNEKYVVDREMLHRLAWQLFRPPAKHRLKKRYAFTTDRVPKMKENFLMVSNYVTGDDCLMAACASGKQMYIVGDERASDVRFYSVMDYLFNPIILHGENDTGGVREILKRLNAGYNVLIYPEKERTQDGKTQYIGDNIAKLCKKAGCALVTYRETGGYAASHTQTDGKGDGAYPVKGEIVHVYSKDDISSMTADGIAEAIRSDIYADESRYAGNVAMSRLTGGPSPAAGKFLPVCPSCGAVNVLTADGTEIKCPECGFTISFSGDGRALGEDVEFRDILALLEWERDACAKWSEGGEDMPLYCEDGVSVREITKRHRRENREYGRLTVYRDRMTVENGVYAFSDISSVRVCGNMDRLLIFTDSAEYEMSGKTLAALRIKQIYGQYGMSPAAPETRN